ncbi:MAG: folate-binding protein YgfZ [Alphaproteobacteria bacterium]|nr:folate-binding protein YgfZ [Alphaproteobacteria bacterium]
MDRYVLLEDRGIVTVAGEDRVSFLQGLVSNDVAKVSPGRTAYAAFLTAQGKFLHDFFVIDMGEMLALDCERSRADDLRKRLSLYKLRSKVVLANVSEEYRVFAAFGPTVAEKLELKEPGQAKEYAGGIAYLDPRLKEMGVRILLHGGLGEDPLVALGCVRAELPEYHAARIANGLPDGSQDMPVEKAILLENGFDELHGIDWDKGCYVGQELTARTKYRGLVRKRLMPVEVEGPLPAYGTEIAFDGKEAGEMRSGQGDRALALLRLEMVEKALAEGKPLTAGETKLKPVKPGWATF